MARRRIRATMLAAVWVLAAAAAARADSAPPPPAPVPVVEPRPKEPNSDQRARFEARVRALRKKGGEGDPSGFEEDARTEAERQREEALAEGRRQKASGLLDPLEDEMLQDSLDESGAFGATGCFSRLPDLSEDPDLRLAGPLVREDFLEKRPDRSRHPGDVATDVAASVYVTISCAVAIRVEQEREDLFVARPRNARYFALISRARSWWNPETGREAAAVLAHAQQHVKLAGLLAHELSERAKQGLVVVRGEGRSEESATARFQLRWGTHIQKARDELRRFEKAYDRDTRFGRDETRQRVWNDRIGKGLAAVRAALDR